MSISGIVSEDDLPVVPGEVVIWPTDEWLIAEDGDRRGNEPHGICAARDRDHLVALHRYGSSAHPRYVEGGGEHRGVAAIGEVGLAGLIYPGERGYQAEKARPLSILLPYAAWELVEPLRRAYRVPVGLANVLVNEGCHRGDRS